MNSEIRNKMLTYINEVCLNAKKEQEFCELIVQNEDIAKTVFRDTSHLIGSNVRRLIIISF